MEIPMPDKLLVIRTIEGEKIIYESTEAEWVIDHTGICVNIDAPNYLKSIIYPMSAIVSYSVRQMKTKEDITNDR